MKEDEVFMRNEREELRTLKAALDKIPESPELSGIKTLVTIVDDMLVHIVYKLAKHRLTGKDVWE